MNKTYTRIYPYKFTEIPAPKKRRGGKETKGKRRKPCYDIQYCIKTEDKTFVSFKHIYRRAQYLYTSTL